VWRIAKPNIDLMRCGWDVKWFTFIKERNGVKVASKSLGIDKEMRVCRVAFNAQQLYCYTKYEANYGELLNQIFT
jgi:hypothetical protein